MYFYSVAIAINLDGTRTETIFFPSVDQRIIEETNFQVLTINYHNKANKKMAMSCFFMHGKIFFMRTSYVNILLFLQERTKRYLGRKGLLDLWFFLPKKD